MTKRRLFKHLVEFHFRVTPWFALPLVGFLGLIMCVPGILNYAWKDTYLGYYRDGDQFLSMMWFFVIPAQIAWGIRWGKTIAPGQSWALGSQEFLFTRPIDRSVLYWAKLAVFFGICFFPALPWTANAFFRQDISIQFPPDRYKLDAHIEKYRSVFADSTLRTSEAEGKAVIVTLPGAGWDVLSIKLFKLVLTVGFITWLAVFARQRVKVWLIAFGIFFGTSMALLGLVLSKAFVGGVFSAIPHYSDEKTLLWFHRSGAWAWLVLLSLLALAIWDSRRRFLRWDYPSTTA